MKTGSKQSPLSPEQATDRLKTAMAGGNFEIHDMKPGEMSFRHGTLMTESAPLLPKRGRIKIKPHGAGSWIDYEIEVYGFAKYWLMALGIAFCWLIYPPFLMHRALHHHPTRLMRNLLQSV